MQVDADSRKYLEEVKKGKPRRFVMICNGVKILNLIVYKRGSESRYKQQAKKADGAGQYFSGVITGKGRHIVFELSREQYERTPGKALLLKQFLEDQAGMAFRPEYALVDALTPVDPGDAVADPEDEAEAESSAPAEAAVEGAAPAEDAQEEPSAGEPNSDVPPESAAGQPEPTATQPPGQSDASDAESPFAARDARRRDRVTKIQAKLDDAVDKLRPQLHDVSQRHPGAEDDLLDAMSGLVDLIRQEQFDEAKVRVADLGYALRVLASRPPAE